MKKILLLSLFVLSTVLSFAQQKKPYIRYVAAQVAEDYSLAVKNYFSAPRGPIPGFPAYVPDSLKCGAFYIKTTTGQSDTLKIYDCNSSKWITASGGGGVWGTVLGTLSNQTDLQTALNAKESITNKATAFGTLNNTLYPTTQAVSNYITAFAYITAGSANTLTNKAISGSTNTITNVPLTSAVTGILPVANGGTGTASPGLVPGTNINITGTWPNQTINATLTGTLSPSNFVFGETPSGAINNVNVTFTLANTPTTGKVILYKNGLRLGPTEFSISGNTITYTVAPSNTGIVDVLLADYLK